MPSSSVLIENNHIACKLTAIGRLPSDDAWMVKKTIFDDQVSCKTVLNWCDISQQEAEALAKKHIQDYLNTCNLNTTNGAGNKCINECCAALRE